MNYASAAAPACSLNANDS